MAIYYEKPESKQDKIFVDIACIDGQKIWMSLNEWLRPKEIRSEEDRMPKEIRKLLSKWKSEVEARKEEYEPEWYIKFAATQFIFNGRHYKLLPSVIGATQELYDDIHYSIEKDLRAVGAIYTFYTGMLD